MKKQLLVTCLVIASSIHALQLTQKGRYPSSGAGLNGSVSRRQPQRSMAERLYDRLRPRPYQTGRIKH